MTFTGTLDGEGGSQRDDNLSEDIRDMVSVDRYSLANTMILSFRMSDLCVNSLGKRRSSTLWMALVTT